MAEKKCIVKLSSATGEIFEVDEAVALQSRFVKNVIEDVGIDSPIPLPNVSSDVLQQVLEYCKCYVKNVVDQTSNDEGFNECIFPVDAKFVKVDMKNLYDLIMAANFMDIETLLHQIYRTITMVIAKKTFGEIQQIFNFGNDFARGDGCLIGPNENQILASFLESLPIELQLEIKIKVGQRFHYGEWSPWRYDANAQMLIVELANLYDAYNMHQQIAIILLHIDIGLVNTLVLQTCCMMSLSPLQSGTARIEWVDQIEMDAFKDLIDGIDMLKIESLIYDEETIY